MSFLSNEEERKEGHEDEWDLDHVYDNDEEVDNQDTPSIAKSQNPYYDSFIQW